MDNIWFASALWIGLALIAASMQAWVAVSVALLEIIIGAVAGNLVDLNPMGQLPRRLWGDPADLPGGCRNRRECHSPEFRIDNGNRSSRLLCALSGCPRLGTFRFRLAVATGSDRRHRAVHHLRCRGLRSHGRDRFNNTEIGKIILAACFINDIGTVLALGLVFANYNFWLVGFAAATVLALLLLPRVTPWFFVRLGSQVSEPQIKFVLVILFVLGGLANTAKSEAVLPAYLIGMVLAPVFLADRELMHRTRVIAFTGLTPFYFLKAGSLVRAADIVDAAGLIVVYLAVKMIPKFVGILPLTRLFRFERREGMYTTLMMSTGLTFGSISALFGLTNHIIDERQYTILLTAVIGSAVVPTLIAQRWFQPDFKLLVTTSSSPVPVTAEAE
jgi:Kef-type K+ transport system membrane component KefB